MTAVAARRTALALLAAVLVLGVCGKCQRTWESNSNQPSRPVLSDANVEPTLAPPMRCGSVPGGGELCTSGYLPGSPEARMVAAALLELRVTRSLVTVDPRGGTP